MDAAPATFVLVHGAWQTAATWDLLRPQLTDRGARVVVVPLTGLEFAGPPLTDAVALPTHVADVVRAVEDANLRDVVLVGHSYAGMIITGAAERLRPRLRRLVYVDAFVPEPGESALQLQPAPIAEGFRAQAAANGGWRLPATDRLLDLWGLEPGKAREFVRACFSDFSIRCFEAPLEAPARAAERIARSYVACTREGYPARVVFERFAARARREGWPVHAVPTGHDCHVEAPDTVAALLVRDGAAPRV